MVGAAVLWGTVASAQSPELLAALKTAEEQRQQGQLVEAFKTLVAIEPVVSEVNSANSLEKPYDEGFAGFPDIEVHMSIVTLRNTITRTNRDAKLSANPFFLKDRETVKLVEAFLYHRQSENAVTVAQSIAHHVIRNRVLLCILNRQCDAATRKPEEFDLMVGKAEKTVLLIPPTNKHRDYGYVAIAQAYAAHGKFDLVEDFMKKVGDTGVWIDGYHKLIAVSGFYRYVNEGRSDCFHGIVNLLKKIEDIDKRDLLLECLAWSRYYGWGPWGPKTPENENVMRALVDLVHSPLVKTSVLCALACFYETHPSFRSSIHESDSIKKRLEVLREATNLLLSLPNDEIKIGRFLRIYWYHRADERETEAKIVRRKIFESVANIEDDAKQSRCFVSLIYGSYNFFLPNQRQARYDARFVEKGWLAYDSNPFDDTPETIRWNHITAKPCSMPSGTKCRDKVFEEVRQVVLTINDPQRRAMLLLTLAGIPYQEESTTVNMLLDDVEEIIETEKTIRDKPRLYDEMIILALRYSLWDEQKVADWLERYEKAIDEIPDAETRLHSVRDIEGIRYLLSR